MQRDRLNLLLSGLGELTGIEGLAADESGTCTLEIDDADLAISIVHDDGSLRLMSAMPEMELDETRLLSLLQANYLGGETDSAVFAVDPASGAVVLVRSLAGETSPQELAAALDDFIDTVTTWQDELRSPTIEADEAEAAADPDSPGMGVRV